MLSRLHIAQIVLVSMGVAGVAGGQSSAPDIRSFSVPGGLPPGQIAVEVREVDSHRGVVHALVCIRELEPTRSNEWVITDDSGRVGVVGLPAMKLHLWIAHAGFAPESVEVSAEGHRSEGVMVLMKPQLNAPNGQSCHPGVDSPAAGS